MLKTHSENVNKAIVTINGHPCVANAVRRIIAREVPIWAFSNCKIVSNKTGYPDLFITNRIEFIPVDQDVAESAPKDLQFTINATNSTPKIITVYPATITVTGNGGRREFVNSSCDKIMIIRLKQGEMIEVTFELTKGISEIHARYQCVIMPRYREIVYDKKYELTVETNGNIKALDALHKGIAEFLRKCTLITTTWGDPTVIEVERTKDESMYLIKLHNHSETLGHMLMHFATTLYAYEKVSLFAEKEHPQNNFLSIKLRTKENYKTILTELMKKVFAALS